MYYLDIPQISIVSKTREEYLLEFEKRLFETLANLFKSINYNLLFAYGLTLLVFMVQSGAVAELSLLGSKFTPNAQSILTFIPLIVSAVYLIINYQLIKIARIFRTLNNNGQELVSINPNAIPITVKNADLFFEGVTGLILSLARWQANALIKKQPFRFDFNKFKELSFNKLVLYLLNAYGNLFTRISLVIFRVFGITVIFYLPVILLAFYQYNELYRNKTFESVRLPGIHDIAFWVVIFTIFFTTICGLILFLSYLIDLIDSFRSDLMESAVDLKDVLLTKERIEQFLVYVGKFVLGRLYPWL